MRTSIVIAATMVTISGSGCGGVYAAGEHGAHAPHTAHQTVPAPPQGQLWPTDEPLRATMLKIRTAVEAAEPAYERTELRAADARSLAMVVERGVAHMVANCRLPPEPDAALHVLIGRMMSAAGSLRSDPASEAGLPQLVAVLRDYQSTFDHPGWSDPAH